MSPTAKVDSQDSKIKLKSKDGNLAINTTGKGRYNNKVQDMEENNHDRVIQMNYGDIENKLQSNLDNQDQATAAPATGQKPPVSSSSKS